MNKWHELNNTNKSWLFVWVISFSKFLSSFGHARLSQVWSHSHFHRYILGLYLNPYYGDIVLYCSARYILWQQTSQVPAGPQWPLRRPLSSCASPLGCLPSGDTNQKGQWATERRARQYGKSKRDKTYGKKNRLWSPSVCTGIICTFLFPQKTSYLYVKCPWCGDDFKQIISHHNVTTTELENKSDRFISSTFLSKIKKKINTVLLE